MSNGAPPRISSPTSLSSQLARELVQSAKTDAPIDGAKTMARAKFERFLAAESEPSATVKDLPTDMPLFGSDTVHYGAGVGTVGAVSADAPVAEAPVVPVAGGAYDLDNIPTRVMASDAPPKPIAPARPGLFGAAASTPPPSTTGERNEDSLLFSLTEEPKAKPRPPSAPPPKASVPPMSAVDEILSVGAPAVTSSPLAAPPMVPLLTEPPAARPTGTNRTVVASILGSVSIVVGGALVALYMLKSGSPQTQVGSEGSAPNTANANSGNGSNGSANSGNGSNGSANTGPAANGAAGAAGAAGTAPAANGATAPGPTGTTPPAGNAPAGNEPAGRAERTPRTSRPSSSGGGSSATPAPSGGGGNSAPSQPAATGGGGAAPAGNSCVARCRGDIACLLSCGSQRPASGGGAPAPSGGGGAASGPDSPSRNDVIAAMRGVQNGVRACGAATGATGTATITIVFASSGRVTTANVGAPFGGTPTGSCMARAVRAAVVPEFSRPTFSVNYPFTL